MPTFVSQAEEMSPASDRPGSSRRAFDRETLESFGQGFAGDEDLYRAFNR
jgi:hypothetical protein